MQPKKGKELDAHLCEVSLGNWIPRGAGAKPCTMVVILEALLAHPRVVLMIDEIDKAVSLENSGGWSISSRNDVYALFDRQVGFENLIRLLPA
jgi:hypothetical protein